MADSGTTHESFERTEPVQGSSDRAFGIVFTVVFRPDRAMAVAMGRQPPLVGPGESPSVFPARSAGDPQDAGPAEPGLDAFRPVAAQNR